MKTQFTPGPWEAQRYCVVARDPDAMVASAARIPMPGGDATAEANARLMASAPELLAALLAKDETLPDLFCRNK